MGRGVPLRNRRRRLPIAPPSATETIGDRIRRLRLAADLTQQELAGCRFTREHINNVERDRTAPSAEALIHIAERVGARLSDLYDLPIAGDPLGTLSVALDLVRRASKQAPAPERRMLRRAEEALRAAVGELTQQIQQRR